jgi:hypothetical protein
VGLHTEDLSVKGDRKIRPGRNSGPIGTCVVKEILPTLVATWHCTIPPLDCLCVKIQKWGYVGKKSRKRKLVFFFVLKKKELSPCPQRGRKTPLGVFKDGTPPTQVIGGNSKICGKFSCGMLQDMIAKGVVIITKIHSNSRPIIHMLHPCKKRLYKRRLQKV